MPQLVILTTATQLSRGSLVRASTASHTPSTIAMMTTAPNPPMRPRKYSNISTVLSTPPATLLWTIRIIKSANMAPLRTASMLPPTPIMTNTALISRAKLSAHQITLTPTAASLCPPIISKTPLPATPSKIAYPIATLSTHFERA